MEQAVLERKVHVIPATRPAPASAPRRGRRQRVAAYCRVSTDSEEQLNSYDAQKAYYTQKIGENPDWEMAGIFADKGITGTSLKKRAEFNRMIAACKRGRIDMILTKSASRFARNTVDCLKVIRTLKSRGIAVIFEKENINTLTESSEFLITLFSSFSQAERPSRANTPPDTPCPSCWCAGSAVRPTNAAPGPETGRSGSSGGVSPGWNSVRNIATTPPRWTRTGSTGPS